MHPTAGIAGGKSGEQDRDGRYDEPSHVALHARLALITTSMRPLMRSALDERDPRLLTLAGAAVLATDRRLVDEMVS